ncbi:transposase family protein [Brachybacterium muris]|uniref:transposase family protein n=1 Tax=Brachybacterium muris TaxID=219301 RepID=UPI0021A48DF3|nr:transposase family protein [Brachybacterium muris]
MSGLLPPLISRTSTVHNHSCVCPDALDRCGRYDLLLDFPGLHLVSVTKGCAGLVLEVESCDPVTGCPGCGVIATGHSRMVVEVIDAPWSGRPVRIRWRKRRWIRHQDVCEVATFVEQDPEVCARRELLSTRVIRWAIGQLRYEAATIRGPARQLGTTWNTVWSQVQPVLAQAAKDPSRFEGVQVLGVDEHIWHHRDPRRRGPKEHTGMVDLTRRPHPTARLLDLVPARSGTVYRDWLDERGE